MRPLPVTDVAAMKTYEPDDHVISIYTRISNRAEYGAPLPAPTVDVPASWDYPDEPTEPLIAPAIAPGLHRRRKDVWPVVVSYAVSAGVWVALGALIGARL
jgi:hypothetical protein